MAAWLLQALKLIATGFAVGTGAEAATQLIPGGFGEPGVLAPTGLTSQRLLPRGMGAPAGYFVRADGTIGRHRRRRRRALTASDRADIAFIAATISKSAAGAFASIIGAKNV